MEWKPIETAGKSAALAVLACDAGRNYLGMVSFVDGEWECVDFAGHKTGTGFYPTHWLPLPEPPKA